MFFFLLFSDRCKLNDDHWKVIVDHVEQLKNIQALILGYLLIILDQNRINQISEAELQKLSTIKELKYFYLSNNLLSLQSASIYQMKAKHFQKSSDKIINKFKFIFDD